jgi:hypothetical protein
LSQSGSFSELKDLFQVGGEQPNVGPFSGKFQINEIWRNETFEPLRAKPKDSAGHILPANYQLYIPDQ